MDEITARWIFDIILAVGVAYLIFRGNTAKADQTLSSIIQDTINDRERMAFAEKQIQHGMSGMQAALNILGGVVTELAKFTPIQADDKLGELLIDLSEPGAPKQEVAEVGDETIKG